MSLKTALPIVLCMLLVGGARSSGGAKVFEDVTDRAGISAAHRAIWNENAPGPYDNGYLAAGQAWADYDNDGWVDLFVTGNLAPNVLYRNQGDGVFAVSEFSDMLGIPELPSGGAVWADYDNDGWRDLYVLNMGANRLYRNLGADGFADVTVAAGVGDIGKGVTAAWGDYDGDGHLDLYVANWSCVPACELSDFARSRDVLYHNNGDGSFTDVSGLLGFEALLGAGFSVSWVDYDNDRDLDIYVVNDKAVNALGNVLWRNDGPGCGSWCFRDVSAEAGADAVVHGMGLATGDYDNDGDLDFYFSNMVRSMVMLENQGDGSFVNITESAGVDYHTGKAVGWGTAFFDYDNDGWLDLYLAATGISPIYGKAGMHFDYPDRLYRNNGDGSFSALEQSLFTDASYPSMGMSTADFDGDGRVDYALAHWDIGHRLYRNASADGAKHNWIAFQIEGGGGIARDAIGTRVQVISGGGLSQMRELKSGSSLGAGNEMVLHFGLGDAEVERVTVSWLNGDVHEYRRAAVNQRCLITPAGMDCAS